jgi:hypothetical protein
MLTGPLELYDLAADPAERRDIAARHPDVAAQMIERMNRSRTPSALWRAPAEARDR